jgi:hypothetical protein
MRGERGQSFLIGGIIAAIILILLTFQGSPPNAAVLNQRFAPQPPDPNVPTLAPFELPLVQLPDLPADAQTRLQDLSKQFAQGGAVPALTPEAGGPSVRLTVIEVRRNGERVSVRGTVTNIGGQPITIDPEAFSFRDSDGVSYATNGQGTTTLKPGESTSFDLGLPLAQGLGLTLIADIPPDPPLELDLLVELQG